MNSALSEQRHLPIPPYTDFVWTDLCCEVLLGERALSNDSVWAIVLKVSRDFLLTIVHHIIGTFIVSPTDTDLVANTWLYAVVWSSLL